ncbi:glycosyltransferase [Stenotrophomonas maltophilia]|uniref:glycosyltransferase family 4 protein n=1 Tax=Stenotrophomonas maltophilia TaxID=40324 RepID=UPI00130FF0D8|nr:glycosyltransferase family 4 protein [Stenotrophomonas maltophilia]MBA0394969.1 glycosyltransferase [Stenotrophomonas maltophilia]
MGVLITSVQVPFIRGGGEILAENLREQIALRGYRVDVLTNPFRFSPPSGVKASMDWWAAQDLSRFCAGQVDQVIHLKFPCYGASHPDARLWLLHQHRSCYELWDTQYGPGKNATVDDIRMRSLVHEFDTLKLGAIPRRYTIAQTVSDRLAQFNGVTSTPIYHPPKSAESFYNGPSLPYIFAPSRLEPLKRQMLLVNAMAKVKSPLRAIIAGTGGAEADLRSRIAELGLQDRVALVGAVSDAEMRAYYANSRAVFFAPYREDYGYVTLEAMLSAKPVITCVDSGGVLEFVEDGLNGRVVEPTAEAVAEVIEGYASKTLAVEHGAAGFDRYATLDVSWDNVISTLLA